MRLNTRTVFISVIGLLCLSNFIALYLNARIAINHALSDKDGDTGLNTHISLFSMKVNDSTINETMQVVNAANNSKVENITSEAKKVPVGFQKTNTIYDRVMESLKPKSDLPHPTAADIFYVEPEYPTTNLNINATKQEGLTNEPSKISITDTQLYAKVDDQKVDNIDATTDAPDDYDVLKSGDETDDTTHEPHDIPPPFHPKLGPGSARDGNEGIKVNIRLTPDINKQSTPQPVLVDKPEPSHAPDSTPDYLIPIQTYPTMDPLKDLKTQKEAMVRAALEMNPFKKLGVYETISDKYYNAAPNAKFLGGIRYYGLKKNPHYCEQVDLYNFYRPSNIYGPIKFITDYAGEEFLVRKFVMPKYGFDVMPKLRLTMPLSDYGKPIHGFPLNATMYFLKRVNVHQFHQTNQQMVCLSQMYNHIPGHGFLTRKDLVVNGLKEYIQGYESRPQCLQENLYFPLTYRLNNKEECTKFFQEVQSEHYQAKKKDDPIQYIIKVGYGAHRAAGLALFDDTEEAQLRAQYQNGAQCGFIMKSLVAQKYISNPLLLDKGNKFDFRIYMLIASVNPLIVYYHDGFLRVSLSSYDKHSAEKNVHFTNTHLSKKIFAAAGSQKEYEGMTENELRDYQMWTMGELEDYLYEIGKIKSKDWLEKELRPKFKEAFIHLARMADKHFYKASNLFELYGLDFVLDENLDIWFIECNASPQLVGTNAVKAKFLAKMLSDMFEIEHAYLKSRMKRVHSFIKDMEKMVKMGDSEVDYTKLRPEFEKVNINKFEPEFMPKEGNGFVMIMDKNLEGSAAYFGNLREECL